jgi:uncharacterized protein
VVYYLDTSALLKRYVQEVGSTWITTLYEPPHEHILISAQVTKVEAVAGLTVKFR